MRTLLFAAVLGLAALTGCSKSSDNAAGAAAHRNEPELDALTVDEVAAKLAAHDGKTFIFDDNDRAQYAKAHVPGAKWLDEENVTAADLPADKAATLIFYCHSET